MQGQKLRFQEHSDLLRMYETSLFAASLPSRPMYTIGHAGPPTHRKLRMYRSGYQHGRSLW
jgi:hypothetical protein